MTNQHCVQPKPKIKLQHTQADLHSGSVKRGVPQMINFEYASLIRGSWPSAIHGQTWNWHCQFDFNFFFGKSIPFNNFFPKLYWIELKIDKFIAKSIYFDNFSIIYRFSTQNSIGAYLKATSQFKVYWDFAVSQNSKGTKILFKINN